MTYAAKAFNIRIGFDQESPFSTGAIGLCSFIGVVGPSEAASTVPFIRTILLGAFDAFEVMVTDLFIGPILLVSYFTVILLEAPGWIGAFSHFGTVHPQEPLQFVMIKGASPVLVTVNSQVPLACCWMVP